MSRTGLAAALEKVISPTVAALGYDLVRIQVTGQQRLRVQIMVERTDRRNMTVDDCAEVSRSISAVLDVEDPIVGAYTLEVSSPGIDRPLVRLADYDRFAGFEARVELDRLIDGRRRFQGRLRGTDGDQVRIAIESGQEVRLPHPDIVRAKLVLTDDLIAATDSRDESPEDDAP